MLRQAKAAILLVETGEDAGNLCNSVCVNDMAGSQKIFEEFYIVKVQIQRTQQEKQQPKQIGS